MTVVDAGTLDRFIEGSSDRGALEYRDRDRGDAIHDDARQHEIASPPKPLGVAEQPEIQQQDRRLGQVDACLVGDLAQVKVLRSTDAWLVRLVYQTWTRE